MGQRPRKGFHVRPDSTGAGKNKKTSHEPFSPESPRIRVCETGFRPLFVPAGALCIGYASLALAGQPGEPRGAGTGPDHHARTGRQRVAEYRFALQKGQYAQVVVEQRTINVAIACFGPDGKELTMRRHLSGPASRKRVELIGDSSRAPTGLRSRRPSRSAPPAATRSPCARSNRRRKGTKAAWLRAAAYARASKVAVTETTNAKARQYLHCETALNHWHAAGDLFEEARSLYSLGNILRPRCDQKTPWTI